MKIKLIFIFWISLLMTGCGDERLDRIDLNTKAADYYIENLGELLDSHSLRNGIILSEYARLLSNDKPELTPLLAQLSQDSTRNGPMFQGLLRRLKTLKEQSELIGDTEEILSESENLVEASDPDLFNDALSDPINVIADMSDNKLARVNAISKSTSLKANDAMDAGAGSQLVGNPGYGQWQTNNNGMSFWQWYGMYSLFSAISPRPVFYNNWSSRRDYSYYSDYGRNRYTSPSQAKSQDNLATKTKKSFGNKSGFKSPYSKAKTGASSISRASVQAQQSPRFAGKSSYSKSKSSSSFRDSTTTSTRGITRSK